MNLISLWLESLDHVALKGALVLGIALMAGVGLRKFSAARRYPLWVAAVLAALVLPVAVSFLPAWQVLPSQANLPLEFPRDEPATGSAPQRQRTVSAAPQGAITKEDRQPIKTVAVATEASPAPAKIFSWAALVSMLPLLWLGVCISLAARTGLGIWRLKRLARRCHAPQDDAAVSAVAAELGLQRMPRVLVGPADAVPMVWGVFRPHLLLPEGFQEWPASKLRAVLLHELAHLKRRDPLALWAGQVMLAVHWFNPLAWLTLGRLRADQERACDDTVLRQGIRPSDYAQHLLDLSRQTKMAPGLSLCALAMARSAPVEGRVRAILDPRRSRDTGGHRWSMLFVSLGLGAVLPLAMLQALEGPKVRGRILDRNGVVLAETTNAVRRYPLKEQAAHVLGYPRLSNEGTTSRGVAGIEKQADAALSAGQDVMLTLDARIQTIAVQAFSKTNFKRGAVVVLDPRSGEVLAMASFPAYDPNEFIPAVTKATYDRYLGDRDMPLMNRAMRPFVPGSTYTVPVALAGGLAGIEGRTFNCSGSVTYGSKAMQCWISRLNSGSHGSLGLSDALMRSCNCFFYQYGNTAGIDKITQVGKLLGLGERTGIELDEDEAGILPNPEWLKSHYPKERWSDGSTANTSIGQGSVLASPLQMASVAASVASGKSFKPQLLHRVMDGEKMVQEHSAVLRADLEQHLDPKALEMVRKGMWKVVNDADGTAKGARIPGMEVAGKTGTGQNWRRDEKGVLTVDNVGWFIGYAPYDKPTLAFAVLVQGAKSGGESCVPIAREIIEEVLMLNGTEERDSPPLPQMAAKDTNNTAQWTPLLPAEQQVGTISQMSESDARRWRVLQKAGDLADLPASAHQIRSALSGTGIPQKVTLTFKATPASVREWLAAGPGGWTTSFSSGAEAPRLRKYPDNWPRNLGGFLSDPSTKEVYSALDLPPWEAGSKHRFDFFSGPGACEASVHVEKHDLGTIEISFRGRLMIAD